MNGLKDGVALVTGAGRGIGRAIALRLGAEGMRVAVNDIDVATAKDTAAGIVKAGGKAVPIPADVSKDEDVRRLVDECVKQLGGLSVLVNSAGVDFAGALAKTTDEAWRRIHDVDLLGPFRLVRAAEPHLAKARGSIVNIGSNHALATMPERTAYAAAKAGIVGLTMSLALELGPKGIRANTVMPGYIQTPIWKLWLDKEKNPDALLKQIAAVHPLRRLGTPDDVAGVVAFLASTDAAFITGSTIVVDGGYSTQLEPPRA
jgi:NAD(P)-dependent dehydrogenase (short-subunit alcohol dehydrogenase family)